MGSPPESRSSTPPPDSPTSLADFDFDWILTDFLFPTPAPVPMTILQVVGIKPRNNPPYEQFDYNATFEYINKLMEMFPLLATVFFGDKLFSPGTIWPPPPENGQFYTPFDPVSNFGILIKLLGENPLLAVLLSVPATPEKRSVPAPEKRSVPAPEKRSVPAPEKRSVPAPEKRSVPAPRAPVIAKLEPHAPLSTAEKHLLLKDTFKRCPKPTERIIKRLCEKTGYSEWKITEWYRNKAAAKKRAERRKKKAQRRKKQRK